MSAPTAKPSTAHLSFALSEPGDAGMCFRPYDLGTDLHLTLNGIDEKHLALLACR